MPDISVCLLFDRTNGWIEPFFEDQVFEGLGDRYAITRSFDPGEVSGFDLVFLLGYTRLMGKGFLEQNALCLVVHESGLPKGRGFSPVQWQVLEGKTEIPVRLIRATAQADAGDIYGYDRIILRGNELFDDIRRGQAEATVRIVLAFLEAYPEVSPLPQEGEPTVYPRRTNADNKLDVDKTIREQFNLLRVGSNESWPSHFFLDGHKYIIKIYRDGNDILSR